MLTSALLSSLHLLGLGLVFGSIFMRARYLRKPLDADGLKRLFIADNIWGLSAMIMIATGLTRALTTAEKGSEYYLHGSAAFWVKMGLLAAIFALEGWPMVTFIGWRIKSAKNEPLDTGKARLFAIFSDVQTLLAMCMVFTASLMARGH